MKEFDTDIVIIGAGPVGLFSIFQAGMLGLKTITIDTLDNIGGQCTALYPEKPIYDIPSHPSIIASELIDQLYKQAKPFNPNFLLSQNVASLNKEGNDWVVTTSKDNKIRCKCVFIAAGGGAFGPNKPPLENIDKYENKGILYSVQNKSIFENKAVAIAGGGDSAVDWAISLTGYAKKVYVIHRRAKFRALEHNVKQMHDLAKTNNNIEIITPYQLHSVTGDEKNLQSVIVKNLDGETKTLDIDYLLPLFGLSMDLGPIANWGLELQNHSISVTQHNMMTNLDNIFAIGDIATYSGKLKLILTGFSEAATACHSAYNTINPDSPLHFEHSTTKGIPKN